MARQYNDPTGGVPSNVGSQIRTDFYKRKSMIEVQDEIIFGQFSGTMEQPRHTGKKVIMNHYLPIIHSANLTDQGIDAAGATVTQKVAIQIIAEGLTAGRAPTDKSGKAGSFQTHWVDGEGATAALALAAAEAAAEDLFKNLNVFDTDYATTKAALIAQTPAWVITENPAVPSTGNLWGSSKDFNIIQSKLPIVGETGGRVNRVNNTRVTLESTIERLGIFDEYTADSIDFDSDSELEMHSHREMLRAAVEISEAALQQDLLNAAGVLRYGGDAIKVADLTGENGVTPSEVVYDDFLRLDIDLNNNRAPKQVSMITGSTNVDTRTVQESRAMLIGSELIPTIKSMTDSFGRPAFKYLHEYAAAGAAIMKGEIGAVDGFRIIVAPDMQYWAGAGADVVNNGGYRETGGKYDVFPMLVIGKGAFTEVGFRSSNGSGKWNLKHQKPGMATMDEQDPFGMKGRRSLTWWYGSLVPRPEWIALIKTVAKS